MTWGATKPDRLPVISGDIARVPLTRGLVAIIDANDADLVAAYTWTAVWAPTTETFYAASHGPLNGRTRPAVRMHRLILGNPSSHIDHRNRDTLDNRRSNLRPATCSENMRNRRSWGSSGFLGAYQTSPRRWRSVVRIDGHAHHLGIFDTAVEAAQTRDAYIRANHPGEFWTFNFPLPSEQGITRTDTQEASA